MTDKSATVLSMTPRSLVASKKAGITAPRIDPADFGERLRRGREQKKLGLQEIADTTKIGIQQLRALERGDLHRLPAGIYRRAIVRQYAQAVGLNVEETSRDLASVRTEADVDVQRPEAVSRDRGDAASSPFASALSSTVAAALVVLCAVAAVLTWWYRTSTTGSAVDVPVAATSAPTPEADAPAITPVAAATQAVRANAGAIELATEPALLQTGTGRVTDTDATEGELRITSEPAGAQVTVNGVGWGVTPLTIRYMPFGKKLIRATKSGYVGRQRGLDFVPDRPVRSIRIKLSPESPETR
jgi:cytoskeletal protein RodZ